MLLTAALILASMAVTAIVTAMIVAPADSRIMRLEQQLVDRELAIVQIHNVANANREAFSATEARAALKRLTGKRI